MSDTPKVDAFLSAENCTRDNPVAFDWLVGLARSLERKAANAYKGYQACNDDLIKCDTEVMRWFKAASPYATPGSLEEGLKKLEEAACPTPKGCSLFGCKDAAPQVPHGVCRADDPNREADQRAGTLCSPPQAAAPTASAEAIGVAPSVSDDSAGTRIPADAAPIDSTVKPSAWD